MLNILELEQENRMILGSIYNISTLNDPKFCTDHNNVQNVTLVSISYCESIPAYEAC